MIRTREDAIKQCEDFIKNHSDWSVEAEWAKGVEFVLEDYKRLIEQEPTTKNDLGVDAVSRQEVLDLIADYDLSMGQVVKGIHALPSVTPQEPTDRNFTKADIDAIVKAINAHWELIIDEIRADIQKLRNCSCSCSDGIIDDIEDIIDKYKAETEEI